MIENIDNIIQLIIAGIATGYAIARAMHSRSNAWSVFAMFAGSYFIGTLHWELFFMFYNHTPLFSYVSDFNWYASYMFLALFLQPGRYKRIRNHNAPPLNAQTRV